MKHRKIILNEYQNKLKLLKNIIKVILLTIHPKYLMQIMINLKKK